MARASLVLFNPFLNIFFLHFLHKKIMEQFIIPLFFFLFPKELSASIYKGAVQCTNIYIYWS